VLELTRLGDGCPADLSNHPICKLKSPAIHRQARAIVPSEGDQIPCLIHPERHRAAPLVPEPMSSHRERLELQTI
jgi:hypothetical protein